MTDQINKPMYGVWIPYRGWVRGANNQCFADYNKEVAAELAKRLGNHAKVYFIDEALIDLESKLLQAEIYNNNNLVMLFIDIIKGKKYGNHSQAIQER